MCRLYGFRANEATKVECSLVHAQNALMHQSRQDLAGYSHIHGWGVAAYENAQPHVERQAWAAYHGEHFRRAAARIYAKTVLAHIRRATVGEPGLENTHPFAEGHWALTHNGTVPAFDAVKPRFLEAMAPRHRAAVAGTTDSEHIFRLFLTRREADTVAPLVEILRSVVEDIVTWCRQEAPAAKLGLNLMIADGRQIVGTRWGRSLYVLRRKGILDCEICGFPHVRHEAQTDYRAIAVASEPLTRESWSAVPNRSLFETTADYNVRIDAL